jgi:hypothetical protein
MAILKNVTVNDTGFIKLPNGNTAQRPGSPTPGMLRYNTDLASNEYYNGGAWVMVEEANVGDASTGGSITSSGGYRIHTFTSGSSTFVPSKTGVIEALVIAGAGGGHSISGGGGAGGYVYIAGVPVVAGTAYPTVIGTGGAGCSSHSANNAQPGSASNFGTGTPVAIATVGGGRGCHYPPGSAPNSGGGSGGGGPGWNGGPQTYHPGAAGTAGQGHPGGIGVHYNGTPTGTHYGGGGGGGAGTMGYGRSHRYQQGRGGEGMASTIGGSMVYRAGGGGGGYHSPSHGTASLAGRGSLGNTLPGQNGQYGGNNTGGGGGGGPYSPEPQGGGQGGPGVVIVRYRG